MLTLGTTRHLGPAVEAIGVPGFAKGTAGRPQLVVYDGGRD
jgi:hypothetical protein